MKIPCSQGLYAAAAAAAGHRGQWKQNKTKLSGMMDPSLLQVTHHALRLNRLQLIEAAMQCTVLDQLVAQM